MLGWVVEALGVKVWVPEAAYRFRPPVPGVRVDKPVKFAVVPPNQRVELPKFRLPLEPAPLNVKVVVTVSLKPLPRWNSPFAVRLFKVKATVFSLLVVTVVPPVPFCWISIIVAFDGGMRICDEVPLKIIFPFVVKVPPDLKSAVDPLIVRDWAARQSNCPVYPEVIVIDPTVAPVFTTTLTTLEPSKTAESVEVGATEGLQLLEQAQLFALAPVQVPPTHSLVAAKGEIWQNWYIPSTRRTLSTQKGARKP